MKQFIKTALKTIILILETVILFVSIESIVFYHSNTKQIYFGTEVVDKSGIIYYSKSIYLMYFIAQILLSFIVLFRFLLRKKIALSILFLQLCLISLILFRV